MRALAAAGLGAILLLSGCGGGVGGGGVINCVGTGTLLAGQVGYEDKPYDLNGFLNHVFRPVRYATVEIRTSTSGAPLATVRTDAAGTYCASVAFGTPPAQVFARVTADAALNGATPNQNRVQVRDHAGDLYYVDGNPGPVAAGDLNLLPAVTVREDTPWKASGFGGSVSFAGGAFNILDVATGGLEFVKGRWGQTMPLLTMVWQDRFADGIGTFFDPANNIIHVKGENAGDSDEYDDDVILHEFGHFTLNILSKDSSRGGQHFINGNTQDARLAWSEGWANFFSGMVRDVNGGAFSNRSSQRGTLIDALFTSGTARSLRFAIEMVTPKGFLPDTQNPANETAVVSTAVFDNRVKYVTSEVSVAAALWDVYAGVPGTPGIGLGGILSVIQRVKADNPPIVTFTSFWEAFAELYPGPAASLMGTIVDDRLITLEDDAWGPDDTLAELNATIAAGGAGRARHEFLGLQPNFSQSRDGYTLTPQGDVDLYHLQVTTPGRFRITTFDLHDGADTYLRLLAADGTTVVAENDNYVPFQVTVLFVDNSGNTTPVTTSFLDYGGVCGAYTVSYGGDSATFSNCPPNAANPPLDAATERTPEYLASQIDTNLAAGDYYIEVARSPNAPPSAGAYGGYSLKVEGLL